MFVAVSLHASHDSPHGHKHFHITDAKGNHNRLTKPCCLLARRKNKTKTDLHQIKIGPSERRNKMYLQCSGACTCGGETMHLFRHYHLSFDMNLILERPLERHRFCVNEEAELKFLIILSLLT